MGLVIFFELLVMLAKGNGNLFFFKDVN